MRLFPLVVCVAAIAACGTDVKQPDGSVDSGPSPLCLEANDHSDLAWIQEEILTPTCSKFNACHKGAALSAGGLNLEAGNSADNLINKMAVLPPDAIMLVKPGEPENSYLMVVLGSYDGFIDPEIGTMPFNNPLLCVEKRLAIERWITALGNQSDAGVADAGVADATPADATSIDATSLDAAP